RGAAAGAAGRKDVIRGGEGPAAAAEDGGGDGEFVGGLALGLEGDEQGGGLGVAALAGEQGLHQAGHDVGVEVAPGQQGLQRGREPGRQAPPPDSEDSIRGYSCAVLRTPDRATAAFRSRDDGTLRSPGWSLRNPGHAGRLPANLPKSGQNTREFSSSVYGRLIY